MQPFCSNINYCGQMYSSYEILNWIFMCVQDFHSLATYLSQCSSSSSSFLDIVSDFHLLLFLVTNEVMPLQVSFSLYLSIYPHILFSHTCKKNFSLVLQVVMFGFYFYFLYFFLLLLIKSLNMYFAWRLHLLLSYVYRTALGFCWMQWRHPMRSWLRPGRNLSSGPQSSSSAVSCPKQCYFRMIYIM